MSTVTEQVIRSMATLGYQIRVISIDRLQELQAELEATRSTYKEVDEHLKRYLDAFDFTKPADFTEAQSIIIVAAPQPIVRVHFEWKDAVHAILIPPMYLLNTGVENEPFHKNVLKITEALSETLRPMNYRLKKHHIPCKLLAARSGLAEYGRNNVCYVEGQSSYYWMGAYLSDMPCDHDSWQEIRTMDNCVDCDRCARQCPTGAIPDDRFLLRAGRCMTLHNESSGILPTWISPFWNNALIGCMRCQLVCPVNRKAGMPIQDSVTFDESETAMLLENRSFEHLSPETVQKLEQINFIEDYELLCRNLIPLLR